MRITIPIHNYMEKELNAFNIKSGRYMISNYGDIKNTKGKILKPFIDKDGYKRIELVTNSGPKKFYVHRLVAITFVEGYEEGLIVNHIDSDRSNNYCGNLEWTTIQYNNYHGNIHGNVIYGATSETRKLNKVYDKNFIEELCYYISLGYTNTEIADKYSDIDIKRKTLTSLLNDLRNKRSWWWVSDIYF